MPADTGYTTGAGGKPKRTRVQFTPNQLDAMEKVFSKTQYPDVTVLELMADKLDLGIEKVCTWFQNRRSKFRRESKKGHIDWMRHQLFTGKEPDVASTETAPPTRDAHSASPEHVLSNVKANVQQATSDEEDHRSADCALSKRVGTIPSPPQTSVTPSDCFSLNYNYPVIMTPPMTPHMSASLTSHMPPCMSPSMPPHMTLPLASPEMGFPRFPYTTSHMTSTTSTSDAASRLYDYTTGSYGNAEPSWSCGQYYNQPPAYGDYHAVPQGTTTGRPLTSYSTTSGQYDCRLYNSTSAAHQYSSPV